MWCYDFVVANVLLTECKWNPNQHEQQFEILDEILDKQSSQSRSCSIYILLLPRLSNSLSETG